MGDKKINVRKIFFPVLALLLVGIFASPLSFLRKKALFIPHTKIAKEKSNEIHLLKIENSSLKREIALLKELIGPDKRSVLISKKIKEEKRALSAELLFRPQESWGHTIWINVGEKDNKELGFTCIAKNSPVLSAGAFIGVVEIVNEKSSLVRLITDPSFSLILLSSSGHKVELLGAETFAHNKELVGCLLSTEQTSLQKGEILFTSGLDGALFPGIEVASISEVKPRRRGVQEFSLTPIAGDFEDLKSFLVLPPRKPCPD